MISNNRSAFAPAAHTQLLAPQVYLEVFTGILSCVHQSACQLQVTEYFASFIFSFSCSGPLIIIFNFQSHLEES